MLKLLSGVKVWLQTSQMWIPQSSPNQLGEDLKVSIHPASQENTSWSIWGDYHRAPPSPLPCPGWVIGVSNDWCIRKHWGFRKEAKSPEIWFDQIWHPYFFPKGGNFKQNSSPKVKCLTSPPPTQQSLLSLVFCLESRVLSRESRVPGRNL